jgi:lysophospholipase L1-like esterase
MDEIFARRCFLRFAGATIVVAATGCGKKVLTGSRVPAGASVLALGDSLTLGLGATPETSYPAVLARLTQWSVVNAGVSGDTSGQALARLPALLLEHAPQLVLISIGGNDFLRHLPEGETRSNIRQICERSLASGAQVMLVAIPALSAAAAITGTLSDHPMYEEIAQALKLPLHANGWSSVLGNASLRADQIHANSKGYEQFARSLLAAARTAQLF